jgi:ketosteroid isomerase-like protein
MESTPPRRFADTYVDLVNGGKYSQLGDLFADDALFLGPNQQEMRGRAEITAFYQRFLPEITPQIRVASYVEQGDDCVYELEAKVQGSEEYRLGAIDHATLDEAGKVKRFTVWTK